MIYCVLCPWLQSGRRQSAGRSSFDAGHSMAAARAQVATVPIHPLTFKPEYIEAFELGTKNTLLDGSLTLNGDVFYYNYTGYQISEIVDRTAINNNYNAHVEGAELEGHGELGAAARSGSSISSPAAGKTRQPLRAARQGHRLDGPHRRHAGLDGRQAFVRPRHRTASCRPMSWLPCRKHHRCADRQPARPVRRTQAACSNAYVYPATWIRSPICSYKQPTIRFTSTATITLGRLLEVGLTSPVPMPATTPVRSNPRPIRAE